MKYVLDVPTNAEFKLLNNHLSRSSKNRQSYNAVESVVYKLLGSDFSHG